MEKDQVPRAVVGGRGRVESSNFVLLTGPMSLFAVYFLKLFFDYGTFSKFKPWPYREACSHGCLPSGSTAVYLRCLVCVHTIPSFPLNTDVRTTWNTAAPALVRIQSASHACTAGAALPCRCRGVQ